MQPVHDRCSLSLLQQRKGRGILRAAERGNIEIVDLPAFRAASQQLCLAPALFGERIVLVIGLSVANEN